MQVIVDDILTSYKKYGSGKKVILYLHGWGDTAESFEVLSKSFAVGYTNILLDLPGFGGTQAPPGNWGVPEYGKFVGRFLKKTNLKPYAVVGHSNGGAIAIFSAASKALTPKKLILIASSGVRSGNSFKKSVYKLLAKTVKIPLLLLPDKPKRKIKQQLYAKIGSDYMVVEGLQDVFKRVVAYDVLDDAANVNVPALLIYGAEDNTTPLWQAEKIAGAIKGSRLETIKDSGHFPHKDQMETVRLLIERYLK